MRPRPVVALALAAALGALLTGCSEPVSAVPAFTPSATASPAPLRTSGPADGPTVDTAASCAAISAIGTIVGNAEADRTAHRISKAQRNAILSSVGPAWRTVQIELGEGSRLASPVAAIVALMPEKPAAKRAGFDPAAAAYSGAFHRIADLCAANSTSLIGFSPFDG